MTSPSTKNTPATNDDTEIDCVPPPTSRRAREIAGAAAGAAIGSTVGVFCGPVGIMAGALLGAAVGALAEAVITETTVWAEKRNATLDAEIGISGGDMGAPPSSIRMKAAAPVEVDGFVSSFLDDHAEPTTLRSPIESSPPQRRAA